MNYYRFTLYSTLLVYLHNSDSVMLHHRYRWLHNVTAWYCIVEGGVKKTLFPAKRILLSYRDTKNTYFHRIDTVSLPFCPRYDSTTTIFTLPSTIQYCAVVLFRCGKIKYLDQKFPLPIPSSTTTSSTGSASRQGSQSLPYCWKATRLPPV